MLIWNLFFQYQLNRRNVWTQKRPKHYSWGHYYVKELHFVQWNMKPKKKCDVKVLPTAPVPGAKFTGLCWVVNCSGQISLLTVHGVWMTKNNRSLHFDWSTVSPCFTVRTKLSLLVHILHLKIKPNLIFLCCSTTNVCI